MTTKEVAPQGAGLPTVQDVNTAPFTFFDAVSNFNNHHGVVRLTLVTEREIAQPSGGVTYDLVVAAHLRCSIAAAIGLRDAIDKALLLGAPTEGKAN